MSAFDKIGRRHAPLAHHIAQLRHAYSHLMAERVKDQRQFADGLIAPVIEYLEGIDSK